MKEKVLKGVNGCSVFGDFETVIRTTSEGMKGEPLVTEQQIGFGCQINPNLLVKGPVNLSDDQQHSLMADGECVLAVLGS